MSRDRSFDGDASPIMPGLKNASPSAVSLGAPEGYLGSDGDDGDARAESVEGNDQPMRSTVYQFAIHHRHHRHHRQVEVIGHKEGDSQTVMSTVMTGMPAPTFGDPMSLTQDPRAPRRVRRNSPAAARGSRVVSLAAWREAHGTSAVGARNARPGARPVGQAPRPDRLGRALAWCRVYSTTGRNPFEPGGLQQGLD